MKRIVTLILVGLMLAAVPGSALADVGDHLRPQNTAWSVMVNDTLCNLGAVLKRGNSLYVPGRAFSGCVPGLYYRWNDNVKEALFEHTMYKNTPGQSYTLQMWTYPTRSSAHLAYLSRMEYSALGRRYPDGEPLDTRNGAPVMGEEFDLSYHEQTPFMYNETNYFSIRSLANTFNWELTVDSANMVLKVNTKHTYNITDYERKKLTAYSWATLDTYWWGNGTPATVRAMRHYTQMSPKLVEGFRNAGLPYEEDPANFRVRLLEPGIARRPSIDFYFTGDRPYAMVWRYGKDSIDEYVTNLKAGREGVTLISGVMGATVTAGTAGAEALGFTLASGAKLVGPVAILIATITGLDLYRDSKATEACQTRISNYHSDAETPRHADWSAGFVLSQADGVDILGCATHYQDAPLNTNGR